MFQIHRRKMPAQMVHTHHRFADGVGQRLSQFESDQQRIQTRRRELRAQHRPETEIEALFREEMGLDQKLLDGPQYAGKTGAFEGANYEARGYYRPQTDCIMFTRDPVGFCAVCRRAIERVIDLYAPRP